MIRLRTAAVSATALLGVAVLAGCSSSSSSTDTSSAAASAAAPASSAAASPSSTAGLPAPIIITEDQTSATCSVGNYLDIVIPEKKLAGTTVDSSDEAVVTVTQAKEENGATFNPGGQCIAAGSATITVTNPDSTTRDIVITVAQ